MSTHRDTMDELKEFIQAIRQIEASSIILAKLSSG